MGVKNESGFNETLKWASDAMVDWRVTPLLFVARAF